MTADQVQMLKDFIVRELSQLREDAREGRAESTKDHDEVKASIRCVDQKLDEVGTRVTKLETKGDERAKNLEWIRWGVGIIAASLITLLASGQLA